MIRVELRYAIWLAYSKQDIYSGKLIENFNDLEIDHIIPKSIDENILKEKISKYSLGKEFTIDSIENLVPTFKIHNRQKAEMVFNESNERFFLAIAQEKKERVEKELTKVIKNLKLKEKVQFKESYQIADTEHYGIRPTYFNSKTLVALNGYLPSKFDRVGSCAIEFYEIGSMISLNHEVILRLINGKDNSTLKEQVLHYYDDKNERAFVIIGTSSLHLKKEAYYQFIIILDDFLIAYSNYLKKFDVFWGLESLEAINAEGLYKLKDISQVEWDFLIAYSYKHDVERHTDNEFCFNANPNILIALDKDESIIKFKITCYPLITSQLNNLALVWYLPQIQERKFVKDGKVWTAKQALNWVEKLLENFKKEDNYEEKEKNKNVTHRTIFSPLMHSVRIFLARSGFKA